jgi:hypothetical protein
MSDKKSAAKNDILAFLDAKFSKVESSMKHKNKSKTKEDDK